VVVITINHRLNVLGFANFSEFSPDFAASGDVGMLDIVHALKWVRTNMSMSRVSEGRLRELNDGVSGRWSKAFSEG
jgi:para-nitrobenzyl esterase